MGYSKLRKFNTDVHVFEYNPNEYPSQISFGTKGKLEKLSQIKHKWYEDNGYEEVAKINLGFFWNPTEHLGLVMYDGGFIEGNPEAVNGVECYLTKDKKFVVEQLTMAKANQIYKDIHWGGSESFALVINGKKNLLQADKYSHAKTNNPRTLIGQKANGNMLLVVVEGRTENSGGLTADKCADLMIELGAINAINADGGGSSEMIVNGKIVNRPSDGGERAIGSALIVFKKKEVKPAPAPSQPVLDKIIALDDGHGLKAKDTDDFFTPTPGKRTPVFPDGTVMYENEFNRAVVEKMKVLLKFNGFKVLHVAPGDTDVPLKTRTDLANNSIKNEFNRPADVYVSVHANALMGTWEKGGKGIETFVYKKTLKEAMRLAECVHNELIKGTPLYNRGIKEDNLHVLRETKMTAILCECAFMDNLEEAKLLRTDAYRTECAEEIVRGICKFFGVEFKKPVIETPKVEQPKETPKVDENILHKVQLGAFKDPENAKKLFDELVKKGYKPYITKDVK